MCIRIDLDQDLFLGLELAFGNLSPMLSYLTQP